MIKANYLTVTEFQDMNPELDFTNYTAATISGMVQRASANVDNFLNYSLSVENVSNELNEAVVSSNGNLMIYTKKLNVQEVTGITLKLGTVSVDLSLEDGNGNNRYDISPRGEYIIYPYQELSLTGTFSIRNFYQLRGVQIFTKTSYRAGYTDVPSDIKDAVNLWTKDIFVRQSNPTNLSSMSQGAISMSYSRKNESGDSNLVQEAKALLRPYLRITA